MDYNKMKKVIDKYDHNNLNVFMKRPTAELFAIKLADEFLEASDENVTWVTVQVAETESSSARACKYRDE